MFADMASASASDARMGSANRVIRVAMNRVVAYMVSCGWGRGSLLLYQFGGALRRPLRQPDVACELLHRPEEPVLGDCFAERATQRPACAVKCQYFKRISYRSLCHGVETD